MHRTGPRLLGVVQSCAYLRNINLPENQKFKIKSSIKIYIELGNFNQTPAPYTHQNGYTVLALW